MIVVEDGTGVAGANSYVSAADAAEIAGAEPLAFAGVVGAGPAELESALITAWHMIDARWSGQLSGCPATEHQAGSWPRMCCRSSDTGRVVAADRVPPSVIRAQVRTADGLLTGAVSASGATVDSSTEVEISGPHGGGLRYRGGTHAASWATLAGAPDVVRLMAPYVRVVAL